MRVYINPPKNEWDAIIRRPVIDALALQHKVRPILDEVKTAGDKAVRKFTREFDKVDVTDILVSEAEMDAATRQVSPALKTAIETAALNIRKFHEQQTTATSIIETMPGVRCWRKAVAIEKVGLYIPGGTAPLFSTVLMLAIPAVLAGCSEIVLCSPPGYQGEGQPEARIHPAILFAAKTAGVERIFKVGGVQAIAAMAYGTESIPAVYKIFGPGNQYVNCAKQLVQLDGIAIDMPAGPSEVCVLADESANPAFVAADLLSQAEHGADSQVLLICDNQDLLTRVVEETNRQLNDLPRKNIAIRSLENSNAVVMEKSSDAIALVNQYAPEHLIIARCDAEAISNRITNAGSVFLGNFSPESAGDYASGTNHTLPTNGFARSFSGVSVDSFVKKITFQQLTREGLQEIGSAVEEMAAAEGLIAHKNAVSIRLAAAEK